MPGVTSCLTPPPKASKRNSVQGELATLEFSDLLSSRSVVLIKSEVPQT